MCSIVIWLGFIAIGNCDAAERVAFFLDHYNIIFSISKVWDLSFTLQQDAEHLREPQQKDEVPNSNTNDEVPGEQEQQEETHVDTQPEEAEQVKVEVKAMEEELKMQEDEQHGQQIPEVPAAELEQAHQVPVHQGQPEI